MNISDLLSTLQHLREIHGEVPVSIAYGVTEFLPSAVDYAPEGPLTSIQSVGEQDDLPQRVILHVGHPCAC